MAEPELKPTYCDFCGTKLSSDEIHDQISLYEGIKEWVIYCGFCGAKYRITIRV